MTFRGADTSLLPLTFGFQPLHYDNSPHSSFMFIMKRKIICFFSPGEQKISRPAWNVPFKINLGVFLVPAVSDDGSGIWRVAGFDPAEEVEEGGGILRHTVIWPGCKLELTHFPPFTAAALIRDDGRLLSVHSAFALLRD